MSFATRAAALNEIRRLEEELSWTFEHLLDRFSGAPDNVGNASDIAGNILKVSGDAPSLRIQYEGTALDKVSANLDTLNKFVGSLLAAVDGVKRVADTVDDPDQGGQHIVDIATGFLSGSVGKVLGTAIFAAISAPAAAAGLPVLGTIAISAGAGMVISYGADAIADYVAEELNAAQLIQDGAEAFGEFVGWALIDEDSPLVMTANAVNDSAERIADNVSDIIAGFDDGFLSADALTTFLNNYAGSQALALYSIRQLTQNPTMTYTEAKAFHYDRNSNQEKTANLYDLIENNFRVLSDAESAFHRINYGTDTGNDENLKLVSRDYLSEFVFKADAENQEDATNAYSLVETPLNMGTYNFFGAADKENHLWADIVPWLVWGNSEEEDAIPGWDSDSRLSALVEAGWSSVGEFVLSVVSYPYSELADFVERAGGVRLDFAGGTGDDTYIATSDFERIGTKGGDDTLSYFESDAGVVLNLTAGQGYSGFAKGDTYDFGEIETVWGSSYADIIVADRLDNELRGFAGGDYLSGYLGDDTLAGGIGDDILKGGAGDDLLEGGAGSDKAIYDALLTEYTLERVDENTVHVSHATEGNDTLEGLEMAEFAGETIDLEEFFSEEIVEEDLSDEGTNIVTAEILAESSTGQSNTRFVANYDDADLGEGVTFVSLNFASSSYLERIVYRDNYNDRGTSQLTFDVSNFESYTITGTDRNAITYRYNGTELGSGADSIITAEGNDVLKGGEGNDTLNAGGGANYVWGEDGNDTLQTTGDQRSYLWGGSGNDLIKSGSTLDRVSGGEGFDVLEASYAGVTTGIRVEMNATSGQFTGLERAQGVFTDGDDWVEANDARVALNGGDGSDRLILDYSSARGGQGVTHVSLNFASSSYLERLVYRDNYNDRGTSQLTFDVSNFESYTITGTDRNAITYRYNGTELGSGADSIITAEGNDVLKGGEGNDTLNAGGGANYVWGEDGNDTLQTTGDQRSYLWGGSGNDLIKSGSTLDRVSGGEGFDVLEASYAGVTTGIRVEMNATSGQFTGLERAQGVFTDGDDWVEANDARVALNGGDGSDRLILDYSSARGGQGVTHVSLNFASSSYLERLVYRDNYNDRGTSQLTFDVSNFESYTITGTDRNAITYRYNGTELGSGADSIITAEGNDVLKGGEGNDTLNAGGGANYVWGEDGNDTLQTTGDQRSYLWGGSGNDLIKSGSTLDRVSGGEGFDVLEASYAGVTTGIRVEMNATSGQFTGLERAQGVFTDGDDWVEANDARVALNGGGGSDRLILDYSDARAGQGVTFVSLNFASSSYLERIVYRDNYNDRGTSQLTFDVSNFESYTITGTDRNAITYRYNGTELGSGADSIITAQGNDSFKGGEGNDRFEAGGGFDTAYFSGAEAGYEIIRSIDGRTITVRDIDVADGNDGTDTLIDVEELVFGVGTGSLTGTAADKNGALINASISAENVLGTGASERINALDGSDWIIPGAGSDTIDGGDGNDMLSFATLGDTLGRTNVQYRLDIDLVEGLAMTSGDDVYYIGNIERITGSGFADRIRGDSEDNEIRGMGDYDWFIASAGSDSYDGGNGQDMISYLDATSGVTVNLANNALNTGLAAGDVYSSVERVTGSVHVDTFFGDDGENSFRGLGGYDVFFGSKGGRERFDGGNGSDTVSYLYSDAGVIADLSLGYGDGGDAKLDLYTSIENLGGTAYDDELTGDGGRNNLRGLGGDDIIFGGGGIDRIFGGRGDDEIDGGDGSDYILYNGDSSDFEITRDGNSRNATVSWQGPGAGEGTDTLKNIEYLVFDDTTISIWSL